MWGFGSFASGVLAKEASVAPHTQEFLEFYLGCRSCEVMKTKETVHLDWAKVPPSWIGSLALLALTLLAYSKALHFGFIWDDDYHVTANPCVVGPWGLREIWTTSSANFFPLVLTTLRGEFLLWGVCPSLYHLVNLLFHAFSTIALWMVLRELRVPGAWFGAALWCVHPVQMESAMWISEQKNTESALFYLLSILFFLRFQDRGKRARSLYVCSLLCALLALASKTSTVVLPLVLLICGWWRGERLGKSYLFRVAPFLFLSAFAGLLTVLEQRYHVGASGHEYTLDLPQRIALVGITPWFYLGKLVWPPSINFIYPKWTATQLIPLGWMLLATNALLLWGLWHFGRGKVWARSLLFAWGYFLLALLPVSGLFDGYFFRYSYVSDHFQYLASMGIAGGCGALVFSGAKLRSFAVMIACALLASLIWIDRGRGERFSDSRSLWLDTASHNPLCWMALGNLGMLAHAEGKIPEAQSYFQSALLIHPGSIEALNNLGVISMGAGDLKAAKEDFKKVLSIDPRQSMALCNLGDIAQREGEFDEAIGYFERAIEANDLNPNAKCSLAALLQSRGRVDQAESLLRDACQKSPRSAPPHAMMAAILSARGDVPAAVGEYKASLALDPSSELVRNELALLQIRLGHPAEATGELRRVLVANPKNIDARMNLALLLLNQGSLVEAAKEFRELIAISPSDHEALNSYGLTLLRMKERPGALAAFRKSLQLDPDQPEVLLNLALVLASGSGSLQEAASIAQRALDLAIKKGNQELASKIRGDLDSIARGERIEIGF